MDLEIIKDIKICPQNSAVVIKFVIVVQNRFVRCGSCSFVEFYSYFGM